MPCPGLPQPSAHTAVAGLVRVSVQAPAAMQCFVSILKSLCCEALQVDGTDYDLVEYRGKDAGSTVSAPTTTRASSSSVRGLGRAPRAVNPALR